MAFGTLCIWSVVGASSAPTGIDSRCAGASKSSKKIIVQGCICDRPGVVQAVYSNGTASIYPRRYCPGRGFFMSGDEAPANFCYGSTNSKQSVRSVENAIVKTSYFFGYQYTISCACVPVLSIQLGSSSASKVRYCKEINTQISPYEFHC